MMFKNKFMKNTSQITQKKGRRQFLIFLGILSLTSVPSFLTSSKSKSQNLIDDDNFLLLDGWILKKEDIYDL